MKSARIEPDPAPCVDVTFHPQLTTVVSLVYLAYQSLEIPRFARDPAELLVPPRGYCALIGQHPRYLLHDSYI